MEFIWGIGMLKVVLGHAMSQYVACKHYFNQNLKKLLVLNNFKE